MKKILFVDAVECGQMMAEYILKNKLDIEISHYFPSKDSILSLDKNRKSFFYSIVKQTESVPWKNKWYGKLNTKLINQFKKYGFDAVITGGESGVVIANKIAHQLSLPCNDISKCISTTDKWEMQNLIAKNKLRSIKRGYVKGQKDAIDWYRKYAKNFDVVIKPLSIGGTVGVFVCKNENDIIEYFKNNKYGDSIIEEYLKGIEFGINFISNNSKHYLNSVLLFNKKLTDGAPVHNISLLIQDRKSKMIKEILSYAEKVLDALGVRFGPSHLEIIYTKEGPVLIEMAARGMSSFCRTSCFDKSLGFNIFDVFLNSYLIKDSTQFAKYWQKKQRKMYQSNFMIKQIISNVNAKNVKLKALEFLPLFSSYCDSTFDFFKSNHCLFVTKDFASKPGNITLVNKNIWNLLYEFYILRYIEIHFINVFFRYKLLNADEKKIIKILKNNLYNNSYFINVMSEIKKTIISQRDSVKKFINIINFIEESAKKG